MGFESGMLLTCAAHEPVGAFERRALDGRGGELHELDIGEQGIGHALLLGEAAEQAVEVLALEREEAGVVEIIERARGGVDAVDGDRRLGVLGAIGDALGIRQIEAVHLHERHAPTRDLLLAVAREVVIDGQLLHDRAVEALRDRRAGT